MKLFVRVIEARNIPALDQNGFSDPYVKLQVGKQKFRTKVVKKCLNPSWCEEFTFKLGDLKDELLVCVLDEDKYFNDDFVGQFKVPISHVFEADDKSLGTAWHVLLPKNKKSKNKNCGEILLTICLSQKSKSLSRDEIVISSRSCGSDTVIDSPSKSSPLSTSSPMRLDESVPLKEEKPNPPTFASRIAKMFSKNSESGKSSDSGKNSESGKSSGSTSMKSVEANDPPDCLPENSDPAVPDHKPDDQTPVDFEELMKTMEAKDQGVEVPPSLTGGVVLNQLYGTSPRELNSVLFSPNSDFSKSTAEAQGSTDLQTGPWKYENEGDTLKRVVSYTKAASKLVKALKATEEQTYLKNDGKTFSVLSIVSTPDAPYGKTFKAEVLYCITAGSEQPSGEQTSRLEVSWRVNFSQSTMMKGMIENGAKQGIKECFDQYEKVLSQIVKPVDLKDVGSEKDQMLASLQVERQSDWKLAVQYFANLTVVTAVCMALYVMVHLWMCVPSKAQGLEFVGLDLPDSIGEVIVCGVLVLQGKRVLELISRFMQARVQKGSDHGIKAQGDGWLLTVALIEGSNLAAVDSSGFSDPYVVFTCNGKTRTSSIKFQKPDPLWNEIFEFDAMEEPPSVVDVEVFDFDGPFDDAKSLGCAKINFLKSDVSELSDIWIPLQGKLAQACQSKLHLRIFLNNNRGGNVVKDYLTKMEKEVGKKIKLRSPRTNSAFQKLFALPPEEFLINDFSCHLKRRMPLQGRLFLSARIIGFHADLFGKKTKFFFLWEDIEDIQVIPPTLSSMGSPIIIMTLRIGRGFDARNGARTQDPEGRLKYHFHSFVSFTVAHRTIMALWKAKALTPEQKLQIAEEESSVQASEEEKNLQTSMEEMESKSLPGTDEESETKSLNNEESCSFLGVEDVKMSVIHSSKLSLPTSFFMELFRGGDIDRKVMEKVGCLDYSHSPWESDKPDVHQRQLYYKFDKQISRYRGEVTSTQQRSQLSSKNGWLVEEIMTLHGVPLGDYFTLHLRYLIEDLPSKSLVGCNVQVEFGTAWLKYTKQQKRITKNIASNLQARIKVMFAVLEKEYISGS